MPSPILTRRKNSIDDPSIVLPKQLYTSVYFLCSNAPHTSYLTLCFPTQIMTQEHTPIHFPHKWINPIFTFNNTLNSSRTHPLNPILMTWVKYLFCSFRIILLLAQVNKIPRLFLFGPYPQEYIYDYKIRLLCRPYKTYTKPDFLTTKINPRVLGYLMSTVHSPTIQHITPIIHYMRSTILNMFTQYPKLH